MFLKTIFATACLAALTPSATLAGGFTICNSLGGGSRVCTSTEGGMAVNSLGPGAVVGSSIDGGFWTTSPLGRGSSITAGDPPGFMSMGGSDDE